jgi:hypothetical protein
MKRSNKILLGIATIWPLVYIPLFFITIFSTILLTERGGAPGPAFPLIFVVIFPLHIITIFGGLALSVFYIVNVFRNERVEKERQVMWVILLFMAGMIAQPIYWYLYIWRDEAPLAASKERRALNDAAASGWADRSTRNAREKEYVPPPEPPDWR